MMIDNYIETISGIISNYGYTVIFLGMVLESTFLLGLIFPGLIILLVGGYYSGQGTLDLALVLICGYLGVIAGDNLSYSLGRYGLVRLPFLKRFSSEIDRVEQAVQKDTERFLVFFHFPVYSRMVLPALLGTMRFGFRRWIFLDAIGAFLFTTTFTMIGYVLGRTAEDLENAIEISQYIQWAFLLILVWWVVSVFLSIRRVLKKAVITNTQVEQTHGGDQRDDNS